MNKNKKTNQKINTALYTLLALVFFAPAVSFAALDGVKGLLRDFLAILNLTIPVVVGLAMIYFFWGVSQFILNAGEQAKRDEGKQRMLWGIVALFVIFSIMGIVRWIGSTIGIPLDGVNTSINGGGGGCDDPTSLNWDPDNCT